MKTTITQSEARKLRARVRQLERQIDEQRSSWSAAWPDGTHIASAVLDAETTASIKTARRLKHAVVAMNADSGRVLFYAMPIATGEPR